VERHFSGRGSVGDERAMRAHLPGCEECRRLYERLLVGAQLDPRALSAQDRLARGLGFAPSRPRRAWVWPALTVGAVASACLVLVLVRGQGGFVERGGRLDDQSELLVYRTPRHGTPDRVRRGAHIRADEELAFAYRNPEGFAHLAVFAVDEHRHVYWYHPAWTDPASDPSSVGVAASASPVELGEAVAHDLDGKHLRVHALFTRTPLTVRQVEKVIAQHDEETWKLPAARNLELELDVDR
jgi:hypothetical protein